MPRNTKDGGARPRRRRWHMLALLTGGLLGAGLILTLTAQAVAYERYNSGCQVCHGAFTGPDSPKDSIFPEGNKHNMHRGSSYMNTDCDLCHTTGDNRNPYIGSSDGTASNPGVGCTGCHGRDYGGALGDSGVGLRAHHIANGVTACAGCHHGSTDPLPLAEDVSPTYYGTPDTNVDDPCNSAPDYLESWTLDNELGLDNDGDNLYDGDDPDCSSGLLGDMNCDGIVNAYDIDGFICAVSPACDYESLYPDCDRMLADINGDGEVNSYDIDGFIALVGGG